MIKIKENEFNANESRMLDEINRLNEKNKVTSEKLLEKCLDSDKKLGDLAIKLDELTNEVLK